MDDKVEKYFDAGVVCKEEDQIPSTNYGMLANPIATWGNFTEAIRKQWAKN
jgi:hypothetical protein